ncbi:MAG: DNA repair exonuclease [Rhodospirillales bacterium]
MASFTFLHAADIHLDSPLRGLEGQEGAAAERIRTATRQAFVGLIDLALAEEVAFVVIAGDLYDGDWKDYQTGLFFVGQMGRLAAAGIPVFLLYGNHDAESRITRKLGLPETVRAFSYRKAESFILQDLKVALHGRSFPQPAVTDNLVPDYPEPLAGHLNIGVLHTGLGGLGGHANYAPCGEGDLTNKGYDYWALGHVHKAQVLRRDPYLVFPGNLQGRQIRETGAKGACLVEVVDGVIAEVTWHYVDVVRWAEVPLSLTGCSSQQAILTLIGPALEAAVAREADGRLLACRLVLTGENRLPGALDLGADSLLAEARAIALGLGPEVAWIERIVDRSEPPPAAAEVAARDDALAQLERLLAEAGEDPDFLALLKADLTPLLSHLPADLRLDLEPEDRFLQLAQGDEGSALIAAARQLLLAELTDQSEGRDALPPA